MQPKEVRELLILGEADVQASLDVRVGYRNIPMSDELCSLLQSSLTVNPFLNFLQVEPRRNPPVLCIIQGKLSMPLDEAVLKALELKRPARMTARIISRILDIKAREIVTLVSQVCGDEEPIEVKYPGLWLG